MFKYPLHGLDKVSNSISKNGSIIAIRRNNYYITILVLPFLIKGCDLFKYDEKVLFYVRRLMKMIRHITSYELTHTTFEEELILEWDGMELDIAIMHERFLRSLSPFHFKNLI